MAAFALYIVVINLVTYAAFAHDKAAAQRGQRRISEATLLSSAILGGAACGLLAMRVHRHKTRKPLFKFGLPLILLIQAGLLAHWLWTGRAVPAHLS